MSNTRYFTEEEVKYLVHNQDVHTEYGDSRRWSKFAYTVVKADDNKYYKISWDKGLTENQENYYESGDFPEVEKFITFEGKQIIEWLPVGTNKERKLKDSIDNLLLLTNKQTLQNELDIIDSIDFDNLIKNIDKLNILNIDETMENNYIILKQYFEDLKQIKTILKGENTENEFN